MTSTALISEKERLYHFYVTCNMTKEETCKAMGYYMKSDNKLNIRKLDKILHFYQIFKPKSMTIFNKAKGMYLKYGVTNCMYLQKTKDKIIQTNINRYGTKYSLQSKEIRDRGKETCLKRYGVEYPMQNEKIKNKSKITCLERYGTENVFASDYGKKKIKETNLERYNVINAFQSKKLMNKAKITKLKKYGYEYYNNREKTRETCLKKYNCENVTQVKEIRDKQIETKKLKGTLNTSKQERIIKDLLNIKFKNIEYQYKSELYPFNCDFYIPELDLYIEFQGHWTHGKYNGHYIGKFDCNDEKHKIILNEWQKKSKSLPMYKSAIEVWTIRDPLKRKTAKENNLNWLEFFTIKDFMIWYNSI